MPWYLSATIDPFTVSLKGSSKWREQFISNGNFFPDIICFNNFQRIKIKSRIVHQTFFFQKWYIVSLLFKTKLIMCMFSFKLSGRERLYLIKTQVSVNMITAQGDLILVVESSCYLYHDTFVCDFFKVILGFYYLQFYNRKKIE